MSSKNLKNNKSPGPDGIPAEVFKEMTVESLSIILEVISNWWTVEDMPTSLLELEKTYTFQLILHINELSGYIDEQTHHELLDRGNSLLEVW